MIYWCPKCKKITKIYFIDEDEGLYFCWDCNADVEESPVPKEYLIIEYAMQGETQKVKDILQKLSIVDIDDLIDALSTASEVANGVKWQKIVQEAKERRYTEV